MIRDQALLLVWCAVVFLLLAGCPKGKDTSPPKKPALSKITVKDHTARELRVADLTSDRLANRAQQRLLRGGHFTLAERPDAYRLKVDLGLRSDGDKLTALVSVRAKAAGLGQSDWPMLQASGTRHARGKGIKQRRAQLQAVLDHAMDDIAHQAMLVVAPPDKVVAELSRRGRATTKKPDDLDRLTATIEIAATRKLRQAVPGLISLLKHDEQAIADRAIGALVAIGDQRAVKPLTRLSQFKDTAKMAKVIDAIGALGGKEAKDYLAFVAVGHGDADIKNLAREALERMRRAKDGTSNAKKGERR